MSIEALKQALETLEEIADEVFSPYDNKLGGAILALRSAVEQTRSEQWWKHEVSNAWAEGYEKGRAQREWVGLTPEEAKEISLANRPYVVDMVAALEQRLKEKNT